MTNFFGVGIPEVILILALTLIVVGPERLPEMARQLGKLVYQMRRYARAFRDEFQTEFADLRQDLEMSQAELAETRRQLQEGSRAITGEVAGVQRDLDRASSDVTAVLNAPVEPPPPPSLDTPANEPQPENVIPFGEASQRLSAAEPPPEDAPNLQRH